MANIIGSNDRDTLLGTNSSDTINGKLGNDTLTGSGGRDIFVYNLGDGSDTIADFGGVGKGTNPTAAVIAEVDTIRFIGYGLTARNLLLAQNGTNLEITFEEVFYTKVILQNFKLEALENLKANGTKPAIGNIIFNGQTSIIDSFDVLDANSTQTSIATKNTVTFLNDLANNITGLDNSNDVINGQGGNDKIDGKSGDDLLRGGTGNNLLIGGAGNDTLFVAGGYKALVSGNNTLIGGTGNDSLNADYSTGDKLLSGGDGNDFLSVSGNFNSEVTGDNTLNSGAGDDSLIARYSTGDNLLDGGSGKDYLSTVGSGGNNTLIGGDGDDYLDAESSRGVHLLFGGDGNDTLQAIAASGNDTLDGGAGNDFFRANSFKGNDLIWGGTGNDTLDISGFYIFTEADVNYDGRSLGNNTLDGGLGNDILRASGSKGNNLLFGGDGNDTLSISGSYDITESGGTVSDIYDTRSSGKNTLNGGAGDDYLNASGSRGDNLLSGGDGNDSFNVGISSASTDPSYLVTQTVDGGSSDDLLSVDYTEATGGITKTFNATTKIGEIKAGTYGVNYKNIERLNILGTRFDDKIVGNNGNDTLSVGNGGKDTIDGGSGDDLLSVDYRSASGGITTTFNATTKIGEIKAGTYGVNYKNIERLNIFGTNFNDKIVGNNGNDTLSTGNGGKDTIDGGSGDDLLSVDYTKPTGGITTTFNATTKIGEIKAGTYGVNYKNIEQLNIFGTNFNDFIVGNNGNDTLSTGNGGKDTIDGGSGDDLLRVNYTEATAGITTTFNAITKTGEIKAGTYRVSYKNIEQLNILGTNFNDFIVGNNGNDTLIGANFGNDTINGGAGNDSLSAYQSGNKILNGGSGNDNLSVYSPNNSTLNGGAGDDYLSAYDSNNNFFFGDDGNHIFTGGEGNDSLIGGTGIDTFVFNNFNEGVDTIYNFNDINETIQVSASGFGGGLSTGVLKASQFTIGTSASTGTQRFIYNSTTGALFFDEDGSAGAFNKVEFARLSTGLALTYKNFVVV
ncbi:MAG: beta strand repeat-containing protein [Nostoc sp. DedSLP01]|nr:calcium-binding protein [Nostoc sp. DedSLP01]